MVEEEKERKVRWSSSARKSLRKAFEKIYKESPKNAVKVRNAIFQMVRKLPKNPNHHPPDRFKVDNPGNFRAFEKHSYRVTYEYSGREIHILRVRHVKQEPLEY